MSEKIEKMTRNDKELACEELDNHESEPLRSVNIEKIESCLCPISQEILTDPVLSPYGHCYQRAAIESWLDKKEICPLTGNPLKKNQLVPCITLRNLVSELYLSNS